MGIELTILVDNLSATDRLRGEHGLSVLIQGPDGRRVLFDAGSTAQTLLHNCQELDVDLSAIDAALVSHGHYDHTGGLEAVVTARPGLPLHAHAAAFDRRYADEHGKPLREISCPHPLRRLTDAGAVFCPVSGPEMLANWLVLSGPIGGPAEAGETFVARKGEELVVDAFEDELFALLKGQAGWVVLTGCCHRGLRNTLRAAKFLAHGQPIAAVVGGLHLRQASDERIDQAAALLAEHDSPRLYVGHCTGQQAVDALSRRFGQRCQGLSVGLRIHL